MGRTPNFGISGDENTTLGPFMNLAERLVATAEHYGPVLATVDGYDVIDCRACGFRHIDALFSDEDFKMKCSGASRRLGIGTVQFGQPYGISNRRGQVPLAEARAILSRAARAGVSLLDTAANYGEAEQVLAQTNISAFRIVTKTISMAQGVGGVIARARQSVATLGRVDLLMVHAVSDLLGPDGDALWQALRGLKDEGVIGGIGISAYVADDPVRLAQRFRPNAIQLPFSLLDQRLLHDGSLARLRDMSVEIHARSIFLQGLLFLENPPQRLSHVAPQLDAVRGLVTSASVSLLSAALSFVLSRPEVDVAVAGVTSLKELEEILAVVGAPSSPELDWAACALDDARALTPSLW
jgi:aryl-alcohol dehydrogenase-like predicted oxidoreductase